jgi:hypothetical protein
MWGEARKAVVGGIEFNRQRQHTAKNPIWTGGRLLVGHTAL